MLRVYKGWAIVKKSSFISMGSSNDREFNKFQTFKTKKAAENECREDEEVKQCKIEVILV